MTSTDPPSSIPEAPSTRNPKGRRFLVLAALGAAIAPLRCDEGGSRSADDVGAPVRDGPIGSRFERHHLPRRDPDAGDGVDTTFAYGGLTGRIVNGHVRLFFYGNNVGTPEDAVYEIEDPGAGYSTNYTQAPRATLVTAGATSTTASGRVGIPSGAPINLQYLYPDGLYWNETTQLLYWTYYDAYNVTHTRIGVSAPRGSTIPRRRVHRVRALAHDGKRRRRQHVLRSVALPLSVQQSPGRIDDVWLDR